MRLVTFFSLVFLIIFFFSSKIIHAVATGNVVKAYIINPPDSNISPQIIEKNKPNILKALAEAQQVYSSQLQGHTFQYDQDIEVINTQVPLSKVDTRGSDRGDLIPQQLGVNLDQPGILKVMFILGADFSPRGGGGQEKVWLPGEYIASLGTSKRSVGVLMHELAHSFGLVDAGWSGGHPCSVTSQQECVHAPPGLGTTIPYPSEDEAKYSIVGSGADFYGGPESSKVKFNNTESSPEVWKLYQSPYINPNKDAASTPTKEITGYQPPGSITNIAPSDASPGDTVRILGRGFGNSQGWLDFYTYPRPEYTITHWGNSEIEILLKKIIQNDKTNFNFSIRTVGSGDYRYWPQIYTSKLLSINPSQSIGVQQPLSPNPSQPFITGISPNVVNIKQKFNILGSGFGTTPYTYSFTDLQGGSGVSAAPISRWQDTDIELSIDEASYKNPTPLIFTLKPSSGQNATSQFTLLPPASPSPTPTPTPTPGPNLGKITSIFPTEVAVGDELKITGNGFGINPGRIEFTEANSSPFNARNPRYEIKSWTDSEVKILLLEELTKFPAIISVITVSGEIITAPQLIHPKTNITTPTPSPSQTPTPTITVSPTPVVQKKKEITKIAAVSADDGRVLQEIDPKVSLSLSFHLPVAGSNRVLIHVYYNDGTERQPPIPFTFNYTPVASSVPSTPSPDVQACQVLGGVCQASCSGEFSSQVGTCANQTTNKLCCSRPVATPAPNASKCPGGNNGGPLASGFGGSCKVGDADKALLVAGGTACSVASCYFNPDVKEYCWYNSGKPYADYQGCYRNGQGVIISTPTPTTAPVVSPSPTSSGFSKTGPCWTDPNYDSNICGKTPPEGAGGRCDSLGQQSAPFTCQKICPDGHPAFGTSVSTCGADGCYTNSCSCNVNCNTPQ